MIREVFIIRALACIGIVLLHSLGSMGDRYNIDGFFFELVRLLLTIGTPMFVFISELVLAKNYRNKDLPNDFLWKRTKYILFPYITFAGFYALFVSVVSGAFFPVTILKNLLGGYHGYFILIIFQFYLLHVVFTSYGKDWKAKYVLPLTLIMNISYLAFFNFAPMPDNALGSYLWDRGYWMPFIGWSFYFILAYYIGTYYERAMSILKKFKTTIYAFFITAFAIVSMVFYADWISVISSKRVDTFLLAIALIAVMSIVFNNGKTTISSPVQWMSQYSFGIYLAHPFYIIVGSELIERSPLQFAPFFYIMFLIFFSIFLSAATVFILNKFPFGKYLIGKKGVAYKMKEHDSLKTKAG